MIKNISIPKVGDVAISQVNSKKEHFLIISSDLKKGIYLAYCFERNKIFPMSVYYKENSKNRKFWKLEISKIFES